MTEITISQLTEATVEGDGAFDVLMRAMKAHLEIEFNKNRIRGPEYSQVYLGSLQVIMQNASAFLLNKDKAANEAALIAAQVELAKQQKENAVVEGQNLILQGQLLAAQKQNLDVERAFTQAKTSQVTAETANVPKQGELLVAQKAQAIQQTDNLVATMAHVQKQTLHVEQQTANEVIQGTVMVAQKCKLQAEYDLVLASVTKSNAELSLLNQKIVSERAQVTSLGVDADSVIGRQKSLYLAQTNGYSRDAEQKVAKLMADTWSARRMTDEGVQANIDNKLADSFVGRAVGKLLDGVGA